MAKQEVATNSGNSNRKQAVAAWTQDQFRTALDDRLPIIAPLLPAHVPPERFRSMVVTEVAFNDKLWVCSLKSVIQSVRDAADLGLSLNKQMKEGDILPVWSPRGTEAQFRPRAIGLIKLARQSGEITDVWAHVVYENDKFSYVLGLKKDLVHEPAPEGDRGEMLQQAYCCWKTKDGSLGFEVIGAKRIARARAASEGFKAYKAEKIKSTPWVEDEEEMIRKTAIIAATKYMPKSAESEKFMRAVALAHDSSFDDEAEHVGVPAAARVVPPRPTRKSVAEAVEREAAENSQRYRDTMNDDIQGDDDGDHTDETKDRGREDEGGDPRDATDRRGHGPGNGGNGAKGAQGGQGDRGAPEVRNGGAREGGPAGPQARAAEAGEHDAGDRTDQAPWFETMKPADVRSRLIKEMIKASDLTQLVEFEQRNVDAIAWLAGESEAEHKKVKQALEGKVQTYSTATKQR